MAYSADSDPFVQSVRAAAERLATRLALRPAETADTADCVTSVPGWWRVGLAPNLIFGDGLLSWPGADADAFSRPVTFFSGREMSVSAGGQSVPFAWVDGGAQVAVVHDRGDRPVSVVPPDGSADGQLLSDSLTAFLDGLQAQTLCFLVSPAGRRRVEICGERTLLVERAGRVFRQEFDDDDSVGRFVARFLSDGIDDGLRVLSCPARMRPMIANYSGTVASASQVAPEVRAQSAIRHLLDSELLELVASDDPDDLIEDLIDELARYLERHPPTWSPMGVPRGKFPHRFADWLTEHRSVEDLYADDQALAESFRLNRSGSANADD